MLNRFLAVFPVALWMAVTVGLWCVVHPEPALSKSVPIWAPFTQENSDLPSDSVHALALSPDGSLWVGTEGGLARLDKDGHWQTYTQDSTKGGLPNNTVLALALGPDGSLWVGTYGGLARLDKGGHWQTYTQHSTSGDLPNNTVLALALGPDGSLWVGTYGGLAWLDKDGHWQTYTRAGTNGALPGIFVRALTFGPDGSPWVGTEGRLAQLDKDGHWQTYTQASTSRGLPSNRVRALTLSPDGSLWVGTEGGLARLDKDGHWQTYTRASTKGGLADDSVNTLALGPDGSLWVGNEGGLARLDKDSHWQTYLPDDSQDGLPSNSVKALALGPDGSLWVGTLDGLVRLDKDGHWQTYTQASTSRGLPSDRVRALTLSPDGSLWVGIEGGLARLDKDDQWQTYTRENTNGGLPNNTVLALAFGPDGSLWVGTYGGLARFDKGGHWQTYTQDSSGHWQTYTQDSTSGGLPRNKVMALALGPDGSLWVGTEGGLARFDKDGHWQTYTPYSTSGGLPRNIVMALALGPDGSLWVGTEGGLARFDKDGHWQTYTPDSTNAGLPGDIVQALALGPDGSLWIGSSRGLGRFNRPDILGPRIVEVVGKAGDVSQAEQTVAVVAFDSTYRTRPWMFHYFWELIEVGLLRDVTVSEIQTKSPLYRANFDHDGRYRLRVVAVDRYGNRSDPKVVDYNVVLPKPETTWERLVAAWPILLAALAGLYGSSFVMLLLLTRWYAWAVRLLTDGVWAKLLGWPFFLLRNVRVVQEWVLEPWFKEVRRGMQANVPFLDPPVSNTDGTSCEGTTLLQRLRSKPRLWLYGRSGMGKSSVFAAWERAYFGEKSTSSLSAAVKRYGFIFVTLSVRHYAALPPPQINRPESWVLEAVRRRLEQFGFSTPDTTLIEAMLKAGYIALALDGANEADRDLALATFAKQFKKTRLLITSQTMPVGDQWEGSDEKWEVWRLPQDVGELRVSLLKLWLGDKNGKIFSDRIVAEGPSDTIISGYDLRLLADLASGDAEHASLPADRIALYRAILTRAIGPDGQPLPLENLKQLAWKMVVQRRRKIVEEDIKDLGVATLQSLKKEGVRIVRPLGVEHEFRHDQMRAFLAALWLVEETSNASALQKAATEAGAFSLNRRDQEELWRFVAPLLTSVADIGAHWNFASDDPVERAYLIEALQAEANRRGITLVRAAQPYEAAMA